MHLNPKVHPMSHRFPPLAAPASSALAVHRPAPPSPLLPRWLQSLPLGELLVLASLGLMLALA
jgi:hypothetical protein